MAVQSFRSTASATSEFVGWSKLIAPEGRSVARDVVPGLIANKVSQSPARGGIKAVVAGRSMSPLAGLCVFSRTFSRA